MSLTAPLTVDSPRSIALSQTPNNGKVHIAAKYLFNGKQVIEAGGSKQMPIFIYYINDVDGGQTLVALHRLIESSEAKREVAGVDERRGGDEVVLHGCIP
ncbi:unnamed protein product [Ceratitis capitata]|uniref:(Mediterranean fruit fly) hypothetical protein n=1 Tax=Ceratitis capitata TaxID=7213 RepID=A0A811U883_CERCA|nr:unnamed protein product [Ceratitis capitata]